ncbi:MAG: Xaa-Pro peptidase family protein [Planctomycetaceae bacterium]|jgi:Xaa-Pro aminopeptidase|nr:Xaa-Pro peptidase family protein [Planctomycetaceae bacterium]
MENFLVRRNKIRKAVGKQKLNALLITSPINVHYLTGFTGTGSLLIRPDGDTILSDPRFTIQIEEECPGLEAVIRSRSVSTSQTLAALLGKTTAGKLGIEAESVTIAQQERLFQHIPHWQPFPTKNIVEELRQIKDRDELNQIRQAIDIAARAFQHVREQLNPALCEIDICIMLEHQMRLLGAEDKSFPSIIGAGARSALPHANPGSQTLADQSLLLFDWGCVVNGYMSDLTRVLIFAPNNKKLRNVYETVLQAQKAAIAAVKPGKTCEEIDAVARNIITDAGFGKHFGHGLGHSIGRRIHEDPRFAPGNKTILKPGMVMTVEPGIYLKGWGGIRIEDDVLVTKSGCEVLSRDVPKAFDEMISLYR